MGANVITTTVTAADGAVKTYVITVTRLASGDATLSGLALSNAALNPSFTSGNPSYTAAVASSITSTAVTVTATDPGASVTSVTVTPPGGGSSIPCPASAYKCPLAVGDNVIAVTVTAANGAQQTYLIVVSRAAPPQVHAVNDAAGTVQGVLVTIYPLANDSDPVGQGLTIIAVTQPPRGQAAITDLGQRVVYTPAADFSGADSFLYTVQDGGGAADQATIAVVVNQTPTGGVSVPQVALVNPTQTTTATFAGSGGATNQVIVPAGAYTGTLGPKDIFYLVYTQVITPTGNVDNPPASLQPVGQVFRLNAFLNNNDLPNFHFAAPVTITLSYTPGSDIGNMDPATLELWYWDTDTNQWSQDGIQFVARDLVAHTLTYVVYHLTEFAYVGSSSQAALGAYLPFAAKSVQVYASNFAGGVTEHWTPPQLTTAPNGQRFLGEFGSQTATLTLSGLEAHRRVLVSFDLYIIRSWDGNQTVVPPDFDPYKGLAKGGTLPTIGPDQFRVNADGATLLDATFSNWGQFSQNYPAANSPGQSGASAVNSLGYRFVLYKNPQDATYHITLDFAHSAPTLALNFLAAGLQALGDESWGVDHVVVVVH